MQISQPMLQLLLYKRAQSTQTEAPSQASTENTAPAQNVINTTSPTSEDYRIADAFAMSKINTKSKIESSVAQKSAKTVSTLTKSEITDIKEVIYNYHNKNSKISFMSDFKDTDEMFNYISQIDNTVSKEQGISKASLWKLTQRDDYELNNNNFFSQLFSSFENIDTDGGGTLSAQEIYKFLGININQTTYEKKVEDYSNKIQAEFETLIKNGNETEILNFTIKKTKEYLTAAGLNEQKDALERLQRENNIGFIDLNRGKTYSDEVVWELGAYNYWLDENGYWETDRDKFKDLDFDGKDDATGISYSDCNLYIDDNQDELDDNTGKTWSDYRTDLLNTIDPDNDGFDDKGNSIDVYLDFYNSDNDEFDDYHGGIFLDKYYYTQRAETKWYDLVATLVHELTHATASNHPKDATQWGEYVAYQVDEDYLDSINKGQYDGKDEKKEIEYQINTYYNYDANGDGDFDDENDIKEPVPTDKWWTY